MGPVSTVSPPPQAEAIYCPGAPPPFPHMVLLRLQCAEMVGAKSARAVSARRATPLRPCVSKTVPSQLSGVQWIWVWCVDSVMRNIAPHCVPCFVTFSRFVFGDLHHSTPRSRACELQTCSPALVTACVSATWTQRATASAGLGTLATPAPSAHPSSFAGVPHASSCQVP